MQFERNTQSITYSPLRRSGIFPDAISVEHKSISSIVKIMEMTERIAADIKSTFKYSFASFFVVDIKYPLGE